ncbi:MAG: aminopeptidase P family protein [Methylobacteriaceae bacterium]|nr:aminopeptidase P family protein [Methylobacteriaceae bacterium]
MTPMTPGPLDAPAPPVPRDVLEKRLVEVQLALGRAGIDALFVTAEDNFRYLTGFECPTWINAARPRYCIVPAKGDLILIVPTTNLSATRATTWVQDIRTWVSPNARDDGLSLVVDALSGCVKKGGCVGAEMGPQSRLAMPVGDFLHLREKLSGIHMVDADGLLREIRKIKGPFEVEQIRSVAGAASRALARLHSTMAAGCSEVEAVRALQSMLLQEGVDQAPYVVAESGFGGYPALQMSPSDRRARDGTVLGIDVGCRRLGYFCDFNRNFAFGRVSDRVRSIDDVLWQATQAGIRAAVPGARAAEVWRAQAAVLDGGLSDLQARRGESGRMGHGIGLRLTEPPSIHPSDATVLAPGMTITIEPAAEFEIETPTRSARHMLIHEENLVVTEDGPMLLSDRAPRGLLSVH